MGVGSVLGSVITAGSVFRGAAVGGAGAEIKTKDGAMESLLHHRMESVSKHPKCVFTKSENGWNVTVMYQFMPKFVRKIKRDIRPF